jgi:hypothetical protein
VRQKKEEALSNFKNAGRHYCINNLIFKKMKEFMLVFRNSPVAQRDALTPEQLKDVSKPWQDWIGSIAAQDKLASLGGRLEFEGATVTSNMVTDGPYAEIKEIILGYIVVKAATKDEATLCKWAIN